MSELSRLRIKRYAVLFFFFVMSVFMGAGFIFGSNEKSRPAFTLENDPVWNAGERAEKLMPPLGRDVPLFVGPLDPSVQANVLALPVLRELVRRYDLIMADSNISKHFISRYYWMVQREVVGPWSMAETVRSIMNQTSPVSSQIGWTGARFDEATDEDLTDLLTRLFEIEVDNGTKPYQTFISGLKRNSDGSWRANAFYILGVADTESLYGPNGDFSKAPGDEKPFFEIWERAIDAIYALPMTGTGESVHVWSFLGLDSEVNDEVNQTLPLVGVSFLLMIIVIGLFFRDWRDLLSAASGLGLLMLWMFGTQEWLGYPRTQVSSMLPILLLALGVDFSFHGLHRWRKLATETGASNVARLLAGWASIKVLRPALGLATVTTMVAFGTAAFSSIQDLAEWGRLAVIYILEAYLLLGIFAVVLRSGMKVRMYDYKVNLAKKLGKFGAFQVRRPLFFILIPVLLTVIAWIIGQPGTDFDVHDYLDSNSRMVRSIDIADQLFDQSNQGEPGIVLIEAGQDRDLADFDTLVALDSLMGEIRSRNWTYGDPTIIDLVKWQVKSVSNGGSGFRPKNIDSATLIPKNPADIRLVLKDIARSGATDPDNIRSYASERLVKAIAQIDAETGRLFMLSLPIKVEKAEDWVWMGEFKTDLEAILEKYLDSGNGVTATLTGNSFRRFVYVTAMTDSFQSSIYLAIGACLIVLILVLRDIWLSVLTIAPVVAVSLWLNAGMNIFGASLNLVTLQVASLAIGLGLDFAIHVTQGIREQRLRNPIGGLEEWVKQMMGHTGLALFASGITDILGFSVLMLSIMPMFTMFSKVMIAMVVLAMAACLFCLPALLARFSGLSNPPSKGLPDSTLKVSA